MQEKFSKYSQIIFTVLMLFIGFGCGCLLKFSCSSDIVSQFSGFFSGVSKVFLNAIMLVVVPLVFCSIMRSVSGFDNFKDIGRIGLCFFVTFILFSIFAIVLGYFTYHLFPIGNESLKDILSVDNAMSAAQSKISSVSTDDYSFANIIMGIIPSNLFKAFLENNMIQIIFVAILLGIASISLKNYKNKINIALDTIYELFIKVTKMIVKTMPVIVFCSMANTALSTDFTSIYSIIQWVGLIYSTDIGMIFIYCLVLLLVAKINPFKFIVRIFPAMITGFTLCSSSATMPISMNICDKKLGIHKSIYSLGIPLGTTINMNGSCITQTITIFFMATIFNVDLSFSVFLSIAVTILFLAIGAPGIPGGALVCISLLLPVAGMPADAIAIIIGLYPLVSMMQTLTNLTGDITVTTIIAKLFKKIDKSKWE